MDMTQTAVMRKKDGFLDEIPAYLANDANFMNKHDLMLVETKIKQPIVKPILVEKQEVLEQAISDHVDVLDVTEIQEAKPTKAPVKKGRKSKK